jgi:hypothetical protein
VEDKPSMGEPCGKSECFSMCVGFLDGKLPFSQLVSWCSWRQRNGKDKYPAPERLPFWAFGLVLPHIASYNLNIFCKHYVPQPYHLQQTL